jgi:GAF domain-containing protein
MKHFLKTGEGAVLNRRVEIEAIHKDGYEFPVELSISPFKQGDDWIFSAFIRNIAEQKRVEKELRKYQDQLEALVETQTAELEDRVHELNALQRLISREGWQDYQTFQEIAMQGYLFDQNKVQPVTSVKDAGNGKALVPTQAGPDSKHPLTRSVSVRGEIIGQLGVYDDPDHPLQPEDQEFLDSVAEQVAEALERARLLEQTQTALAETENLYEVGRYINEANDLQEILAVVGESGPVPVVDRISLETFERDASDRIVALEVLANWSSKEDVQPLPVGSHFPLAQYPHLRVFVADMPIFIDDIQLDTRVSPESRAAIAQLGFKATAVLPLYSGNQQFGVLVLGSEEAYTFTQREMQPYIALAGQIAVAVENQRLLAETAKALAEAEAAQRRYTVQTWDAYRSKQVKKSYEQSRDNLPAFEDDLPPEVSRAVSNRQTVVVAAPPQLSGGETHDDSNEERTLSQAPQSGVVVPLAVRGEVIGVLGLQETDSNRQWTPEEIALVEAIAEQMAQAAEGIRLLDDSQQRAARERRVNEIGDKIQGAQSLEEALQIAVKEVGLSLEAPQTKVKLSVE